MADLSKRSKKARKRAARRAKATRKVVAKTSTRTKVQALAGLAVAAGAAAAVARLFRGSSSDSSAEPQRYAAQPISLPNTPAQPATTTPPPGAGTREAGMDTGTLTETERARLEQTS